jgi:hypothetical protein
MKKLSVLVIGIIVIALTAVPVSARGGGHGGGRSHGYSRGTESNSHSTKVRSYNRKNGTHVNSYHRTIPNHSKRDNYSTKGNYDPWTGKTGTKNPDAPR